MTFLHFFKIPLYKHPGRPNIEGHISKAPCPHFCESSWLPLRHISCRNPVFLRDLTVKTALEFSWFQFTLILAKTFMKFVEWVGALISYGVGFSKGLCNLPGSLWHRWNLVWDFLPVSLAYFVINVIKMVFQPWKSPDSYFIDQIHLLTYYEWKVWPIYVSWIYIWIYVYLSTVYFSIYCLHDSVPLDFC